MSIELLSLLTKAAKMWQKFKKIINFKYNSKLSEYSADINIRLLKSNPHSPTPFQHIKTVVSF
jgi:hypothetical protein